MVVDVRDAVPRIKAFRAAGKKYPGLCLKLAREAQALPAVYPSARKAWEATPKEHRHTGKAPKGFPEFYDIGEFGHVTTSNGDGNSWTNVTKKGGKIELVAHSSFARPLGWASWLNGEVLVDPTPPPPPPKPTKGVTTIKKGITPKTTWSRKTPEVDGKRVHEYKVGDKVRYTKVVKANGHTWLVTRFGNYVLAGKAVRGK